MSLQPHADPVRHDVSLLTDQDLFLFNEGTHYRLYEKLGAHVLRGGDGAPGTYFAVWAPNAERAFVFGDFNGWNKGSHPLQPRASSGIWEGFIPGIEPGTRYKYHLHGRGNGFRVDKSDPFAFCCEEPPRTASEVCALGRRWNDEEWMAGRGARQRIDCPWTVYELHPGSWQRTDGEMGGMLGYRALAERLVPYLLKAGFTHVEFMPVMEHPFYGSWGYQTTGYYAPSRRYGSPQDFMYLVERLHREGIGVILDWVPSHFPSDEHGLSYFDGTYLYEHADPRKGYHPDWKSLIFNYGRNEVRSFLISNAVFWLDHYHADALRVDAVASMLYLDYSRSEGEWIPNRYGGRENLEAIQFIRELNAEVYRSFPDVQTMAEESTSWPMVSRPTYLGGLGFGLKWDMGWMHDTLVYFSKPPVYRKFHHNDLTFRMLYAFHENFVLPLSHDEVVHGKGSLLGRMPGDEWQRFANLRLLYAYQYAQPGKKLLFMGGEFGQSREWHHDRGLDWHLLQYDPHRGVQLLVEDLNRLVRRERALHEMDCDPAGFEWIDCHASDDSTLSWVRWSRHNEEVILAVCNFTPVPRFHYRVGVPRPGWWRELLNSDAREYWGSGIGNGGGVQSEGVPFHGRPFSLDLSLPPLSVVFFRCEG